jgi:hypothetical protein
VSKTPAYDKIPDPEKLLPLDQLLKLKLPPKQWAVPGLLPSGLAVLAGRPKLGKSYLVLQLGLAVATGGDFLGVKVQKGGVVYLALEDDWERVQERSRAMIDAQHIDPVPSLLAVTLACKRQDQGGLMQVRNYIHTPQTLYAECIHGAPTRLVVLDCWSAFRGGRKTSDVYQEDNEQVRELAKLARETGVTIVILHHVNKNITHNDPIAQVSGTMGLTGGVDTVLVMRRAFGERDATIQATGRDARDTELALRWHPDNQLWASLGNAQDHKTSQARQQIIALFKQQPKDQPTLTPLQVANLLGQKRENIRQLMIKMRADLQLAANGDGKYWLPEPSTNGHTGHSGHTGDCVPPQTAITDHTPEPLQEDYQGGELPSPTPWG